MREKIHLSDQTILFINLSPEWNTSARQCLNDVVLMRNGQARVKVICYANIILEKELKTNSIDVITIVDHGSVWRNQLELMTKLKSLLIIDNINLVHSYSYDSLLPIGVLLKRNTKIPIVYSCNEDITRKYKNWFHDFFITRIDLIFVFSRSTQEELEEILPIQARKIMYTSFEFEPVLKNKILTKRHDANKLFIGVYLAPDLDNVQIFTNMVRVLEPLKNGDGIMPEVRFFIFSTIPWNQHPLFKKLKSFILERRWENDIIFQYHKNLFDNFYDFDVFLSLENTEQISDYEILGLLAKKPLILPRTSGRVQLLENEFFGLTYQFCDVRELKDKILKISQNYDKMLTHIDSNIDRLWEAHSGEGMINDLPSHYERLIIKRDRFSHTKDK